MKILGKRVLLEKIETENVTAGGIILSEPKKERIKTFIVKGVGPEVVEVAENDKVMVDTYKLQKLDDNLSYCDIDDVVGVIVD